jgi:transcriptional regulator with XRE-family HTH domain
VPTTTDPFYDPATLKSWREDAGLSRERVCADLEERGTPVSFSWLMALENGSAQRSPSLAILSALAGYYRRDLSELFARRAAAS